MTYFLEQISRSDWIFRNVSLSLLVRLQETHVQDHFHIFHKKPEVRLYLIRSQSQLNKIKPTIKKLVNRKYMMNIPYMLLHLLFVLLVNLNLLGYEKPAKEFHVYTWNMMRIMGCHKLSTHNILIFEKQALKAQKRQQN